MNLAQKIRWACLKASINAYKLTMDASYPKDPNPENWVTMENGEHVHLSNGKFDGGAGGKFNGMAYTGQKGTKRNGNTFSKKQNNINEGLKAVKNAPVGTIIQVHNIGFGSSSNTKYKITGTENKKKLSILNEKGQIERSVVLNQTNIKNILIAHGR